MRVSQLIRALKEFPQDTEVLISQDEEGNAYKGIHELGAGNFIKEGCYFENAYEDDGKDGKPIYTAGSKEFVVIWPIG